jgi:hypothetical protein
MRVTNLVAREHLRPDVILPSVTGQSEFRGNKSEHALKKTASTIMAVATGGKCAASNQTQKKVALAMALTKFVSSHVVVLCAADHPYFCRRFGYCFSGFFCPVELERNKNAINCPELSRHAALPIALLSVRAKESGFSGRGTQRRLAIGIIDTNFFAIAGEPLQDQKRHTSEDYWCDESGCRRRAAQDIQIHQPCCDDEGDCERDQYILDHRILVGRVSI